ncbi:MAG: hypothetical protein ACLQME_06575 [Alphaproteobacteria bacterium]
MNFIEQIFGISPDGGNGSLETLIVTVAFLVPVLIYVLRRRVRRS